MVHSGSIFFYESKKEGGIRNIPKFLTGVSYNDLTFSRLFANYPKFPP